MALIAWFNTLVSAIMMMIELLPSSSVSTFLILVVRGWFSCSFFVLRSAILKVAPLLLVAGALLSTDAYSNNFDLLMRLYGNYLLG